MGIAAMILGIIGLIFCWFWPVGLTCSIGGIVLGAISIAKNMRKGMGIAGLICGILGVIVGFIVLIAVGVAVSL